MSDKRRGWQPAFPGSTQPVIREQRCSVDDSPYVRVKEIGVYFIDDTKPHLR